MKTITITYNSNNNNNNNNSNNNNNNNNNNNSNSNSNNNDNNNSNSNNNNNNNNNNKVKNDHRSKFSTLSNWKEEAWKNQGFNGIWTRDLHDTGAMLCQLSYEATHCEQGQFIEFISPVRSEMMWSIYEIIHIFALWW